jgi:hypothetical protein
VQVENDERKAERHLEKLISEFKNYFYNTNDDERLSMFLVVRWLKDFAKKLKNGDAESEMLASTREIVYGHKEYIKTQRAYPFLLFDI